MSDADIRALTQRLVADARARDDPTGWFEPLYAAAEAADGAPPWNRDEARVLLRTWLRERRPEGAAAGETAIVVGCGLGADAEHVAALGYATTAFDLSPTAIRLARERSRHPVDYEVADLLALPARWRRAFDLVVECFTVQSLPDPPRGQAIAAIADLVAPGGTLVVVAHARADDRDPEPDDGPPWALPRSAIEAFATGGVELVDPAIVPDPERPGQLGWRAELRRPASS